jgi:hypothetical protein
MNSENIAVLLLNKLVVSFNKSTAYLKIIKYEILWGD